MARPGIATVTRIKKRMTMLLKNCISRVRMIAVEFEFEFGDESQW